ncbi:MAG: hypothetical protein OEP95_12060 [Myxococcales bacterium]|nr:hypothetical protein [Myxococcales bacterium]
MRRPPLALAWLALLAWGLSGCALVDANKTKLRLSHLPTNPLDKKSPRDRFVEALGKSKDPNSDPFALALAPIELWAPFTLELTVGIFDLDDREASLGSTACLELASVGALGQPLEYVCADFLQGLTQTRSSVDAGLIEEHFAVFEVELQIEADAGNLFFRSRERDAEEWIDIASQPFVQMEALLAGISVTDLLKKGRLGFDDLRVVRSGTAPGVPTDAELFTQHVEVMLLSFYEACVDLDGAEIEFAEAQADLDAALLSLSDAEVQLQLLPETRETRKAGKRLQQTEKKIRSAISKIAKQKETPAIKRIQQAIKSGADAILLVEPRAL